MKRYNLGIFNKEQKKIFPKLSFLKKEKFYLAGGTGLSLHLGHRTSVDFDFYTKKHFDAPGLYDKMFSILGDEVEKTGAAEDTLFCRIGHIETSFFWYKYPLIGETTEIEGVPVASVEDIAAMKMVAVSGRPAKRDYIDIYFLMKKFNLEELLKFSEKKFKNFNSYYILRALTYFEDIDAKEEKRAVAVFDKNFSWDEAKRVIFKGVKKYQLAMFKK